MVGARNPKHMRDMVMVVGPLIPEVFNNLASLELELFLYLDIGIKDTQL